MLGCHDVAVFHYINGVLANPIFDLIMPLVTRLGSGEFIFMLAVFIIFFSAPEKQMAGIVLLASLTIGYFVVEFLKTNVAIPRPFMSMTDVRILIDRPNGFSFPSGHSFNAFMAAVIMTRYFSKDWVWYSCAALVAFSRIDIGVHYPCDVLSGALIGIVAGYLLVKVVERAR